MLLDAADDITAFAGFPLGHWKKIWNTNPLERLNKEIKRRTDVVSVFPNPEAPLPLRRVRSPARRDRQGSQGGSHTLKRGGKGTTKLIQAIPSPR